MVLVGLMQLLSCYYISEACVIKVILCMKIPVLDEVLVMAS